MFYKPLQRTEIFKIVDLLVADLEHRLEEKQLTVELTEKAKDLIVDQGFDPIYGARPLKRYLQSHVETMIAKLIIRDDPLPRTHIVVDAEDGELKLHTVLPAEVQNA